MNAHMSARSALIAAALALLARPAAAKVLLVGPGQTHATPCAAVAAAAAGDTIEVASGTYTDDACALNKDGLTIRGVGPTRPRLVATASIANGKGIFVVPEGVGPTTIENLAFEGARVADDNGAGIRMQGKSLTVRGCLFRNNQNGILSGGTPGYELTVEHSELDDNGNAGSGQEHNIYVGAGCRRFVFRYNYSHHAKSGHLLKSRCDENHVLYNRLSDESTGSSSYVIDLPQGGLSYVIGNVLHKGAHSENTSAVLSYKCESPTNPQLELFVVNNTIVNDTGKPAAFVRACQASAVQALNNLHVGPGALVGWAGGTPVADGNLQTATPGFADQAGYDYRLTAGSPAIDKGVPPGSAGSFDLAPTHEYVHPAAQRARPASGAIDVGAHEHAPAAADAGPADAAPAGDRGSADAGAADGPAREAGTTAEGGIARDGSPAAEAGARDARLADGGRAVAEGGCGCTAVAARSEGAALACALLLLAWRAPRAQRRRRRVLRKTPECTARTRSVRLRRRVRR